MNIVAEIGEAGKTTVYVRKFDPERDEQEQVRRGQGAAALRGDLHPLRPPRLPGALHPGLAALRLPVSRRRLRLRGQGRRRPARAPARPLLHARRQRPRGGRRALLGELRAASASRRATRRTTSTGSGSTSTRRGPAHEQAGPAAPEVPAPGAPRRAETARTQGRRRERQRQRPGPATKLREGAAEGGAQVVGWLDERTGASPFLRGLALPQGPQGHQLVLHAGLGHDVRVRLAGGHGRVPGDVLQPGPGARLRVGGAHHQRGLPRRAGARHAPLGRHGDDHPDLPAHGQDVRVRRLQVPARAELDHRRDPAGAHAGDGPHRLPAAVRPALVLGHGRGREHQRLRAGDGPLPRRLHARRRGVRRGRRCRASTRCTCC